MIRAFAHLPIVKRRAPDIASWFTNPEGARRKGFEIPFRGLSYRGEIQNRIDWCVYFIPDFLAPEIDLVEGAAAMMRRRHERFVCYDIGANIGHVTLAMATIADEVVTFEPSPYAMVRLRQQVAANRMRHVRCLNIGLGEVSGSVKFDIFSNTQFQAKKASGPPGEQTYGQFDAVIKRGDEIVEQQKLPPPSFIRINAASDVLAVLNGLKRTLATSSPIMLIEMSRGCRNAPRERSLRAALYPDAELFTLSSRLGSMKFAYGPYEPAAHRVLCLPAWVKRVADQDLARQRSLKLIDG